MIKKLKLSAIKFLCGILTAASVLAMPQTCFASTVPERVNSLLQDIYSENPELKKTRKKYQGSDIRSLENCKRTQLCRQSQQLPRYSRKCVK